MSDGFILIVRMAIRVLVPVLLALVGVFEIHPIPTASAALQSSGAEGHGGSGY